MDLLAKNLLILASAGSGKTFQLGNRVVGLVARGTDPERIVALTFTRKAAGEFADSVLTKLAEAASEGETAGKLRKTLELPDADFSKALARVVRALPRMTLGTMDGFFSKIVRSFQYELGLTGGKFDLIEGPRAAALKDEMLAVILGDMLTQENGEQFFHAFRRATIGREEQTVANSLRAFISLWQDRYRESPEMDWGPELLSSVDSKDWLERKSSLAARIRNGLEDIQFTRKGQRESLEKEISNLENHVIGGGSLGGRISSLMESILNAVATQASGPLIVKSYKEFAIGGIAGEALREMVELAAHCEFSAALQRTRAVREVISAFDSLCASRLRRKGRLGFNDVKLLMGEWAHSEEARLRREAVDFRLDARIDHWLLDEFQDTSRADWNGLLPLIDEAATDDDGSIFIVGDRKQAIYAWRGGDVSLFEEVIGRYGGGLRIEPLDESWRSCPEVLGLVNRVCGDQATLSELFGEAASKWIWHDHVPAEPLSHSDRRGQARVEVAGDWEERLERTAQILKDLGVGKRPMTCGILLRGNEKARQAADDLRARGFDVIEEGRREPGKDAPVGLVITHLLKWLADPADAFARGVVSMSPLSAILRSKHGPSWREIWISLTREIAEGGFAHTLDQLITGEWHEWSDFGRRRAGDLLAALAALDRQDGSTIREAADLMERLELSQNPGTAAVQVMTIHKSKGLGFDVVILPDIPNDVVPQAQYFDVAEGGTWLAQTPPKWARAIIPELRTAEDQWGANQRYEAFCMLYVALTRAKRGLYVLMDPPSGSMDPDKPSLANWLARSLVADGNADAAYTNGSDDWVATIPESDSCAKSGIHLRPLTPTRRRAIDRPSSHKTNPFPERQSLHGRKFGSAVHSLLETIAWIDESPPDLPDNDVGHAVARILENGELKPLFEKGGRRIDLFREQSADFVMDGQLVTGVIDRLLVYRRSDETVERVRIIDFKTDAVENPDDLVSRYSEQMNGYQQTMRLIYPEAEILCVLVSTKHGRLIPA